MTTVAQFTTSTYTFTTTDSVRFDINTASGAQALVRVNQGNPTGPIIQQLVVTTTRIIGPFDPGDVLTVYAQRGSVDYTIVSQEATHPLSDAQTQALQSWLDGSASVWLTGLDTAGSASIVSSTQAQLDAAAALYPTGFTAYLPRGVLLVDATIQLPDYCVLDGVSRDFCTIKISASIATSDSVIRNKSVVTTSGALSPSVKLRNITFDGSARVFPAWLSKSDGTPVTDPQADYRAGGCLAPTTVAVPGTVTVSGGQVTGIALGTGGAGYVYPPTVWITGDGVGATATASYSSGAVTGYTVTEGGYGYTTAAAEVAGGGADPRTALYAANRRNSSYNLNTSCVNFRKVDRGAVQHCRFINYGGNCINDGGGDALIVEHNEFIDCGQSDFVGNCLWSQSYGSSGDSYYRQSTSTQFRFNTVTRQLRSVCLFGGIGQRAHHNIIRGWKESAFFLQNDCQNPEIYENDASYGTISDIVCTLVEAGQVPGVNVHDNTITDLQGQVATFSGNGSKAVRNKLILTQTPNYGTLPFGPYSERVGFGGGSAAIAGTQCVVRQELCAFKVSDVDNDAANAPKSANIIGNHIKDPNGYLKWLVTFARGASKSVGPVLIEGNDITEAPSITMFDPVAADDVLQPNQPFRVINNPGHASMGAVLISTTVASGTSGQVKYTFGFRPRTIHVLARTQQNSSVVGYFGMFADQASRNPGTVGGTNTSGAALRINDDGTNRNSETQNQGGIAVRNAGNTLVFSASAIGFSSDGWTMNVTTSTATIDISLIAIP